MKGSKLAFYYISTLLIYLYAMIHGVNEYLRSGWYGVIIGFLTVAVVSTIISIFIELLDRRNK